MLALMRKAFSRQIVAVPLLVLGLAATSAAGGAETREHYLDIPGLGRIPIPLPPGSHVFGPGGEPPSAPNEPPRANEPPHAAEKPRDGLAALFARLAGAEGEEEGKALARAIARFWMRSGSPTADLLLARARVAAEAGDRALAFELLDRIIALEPGWAQALVERADIRLAAGDAAGGESDLEAAVRLDPRRFDALGVLGALRERAGESARALDAYRRARALDPSREDWRRAEERLRLEVEGRDI
jgi:tetratricopeptide (TPR) repeat protein